MKSITAALTGTILLMLSNSILAALPYPVYSSGITLPQFTGSYVAGISALYLQPAITGGDINYAFDDGNHIKTIKPGYAFGYAVNLAYLFAKTSNDVNLTYFHVDTSDVAASANANGSIMPFDFPVIFADPSQPALISPINQANATVDFILNQLNLGVGQYFDIGGHWRFHARSGVGYADIERDIVSNYNGTNIGEDISPIHFLLSSDQQGDFRGFGPFIGLDSQYNFTPHFALVYHMTGELLAGRNYGTINFTLNQNSSPQSAPQASISDNAIQIVPNAQARIGGEYNCVFSDNSALTLGLGYEVDEYYEANSLITTNLAFPQVISNSVETITSDIRSRTNNMSFNGPYLDIIFHSSLG